MRYTNPEWTRLYIKWRPHFKWHQRLWYVFISPLLEDPNTGRAYQKYKQGFNVLNDWPKSEKLQNDNDK